MKSTGNSDPFLRARALFRNHLLHASADNSLTLLAAQALASAPTTRRRRIGRILRCPTPSCQGLIFKFYGKHRYFDRLRPSRARLAYAAGLTLRDLGIPTVEPVGFVENTPEIAPFDSCLVMREKPGAVHLREWIRRHRNHMTEDSWRAWRQQVCEAWLQLGRVGVYHDDTKALNLLTDASWSPKPRFLVWIDLESVHAGRRPGLRGVLRNLVQLNGSLRKWVPNTERFAFLEQASAEYPWLAQKWVPWVIRWWTRRRLRHEVRTRCGP